MATGGRLTRRKAGQPFSERVFSARFPAPQLGGRGVTRAARGASGPRCLNPGRNDAPSAGEPSLAWLTGIPMRVSPSRMHLWLLPALVLLLNLRLRAETAAPSPTANEIITRFIERSRANSNRQAEFAISFIRRTTAEQIDARGTAKERKTKEQLVELRGFEQSVRLLTLNGRPVTAQESSRESEEESARRRRFATRSDRNQRGNIDFIDEKLIRRFTFAPDGTEIIDGRLAFRLRFGAADQPEAKEIADRVLGLLAGTVWIDAEQFELAKLDASLTSGFTFWGGIVGSLDRFEMKLDRQRLDNGLWVNRRLTSRLGGRKLLARFEGRFQVEQDSFQLLDPVRTQ